VLAPGFLDHVERIGLKLKQRLAELKDRHPSVIEEIRGEGLLLGVRTRSSNVEFAAAAREEHLLTVPAGDNVVRLLPPLVISDAEVAEAFDRLDRACVRIERAARKGAAA
jgi:acetylornithine/N-succinyldiaminopimelate aminotransferase